MAKPHRYRRHQRVREAASTRYSPAPPPSTAVTGILLDSDVIIEALRGRRESSDGIRAIEHRGVPTYCCAVSFAEIWAGVRPGEGSRDRGVLPHSGRGRARRGRGTPRRRVSVSLLAIAQGAAV